MTNFEKICKGTAEELAKVLAYPCKNCAYDKTALCLGRMKNCSDGVLKWLNKKATPELTQVEREICIGLKHLGYKYLARDYDKTLNAHTNKPHKATFDKWAGSWWHIIDAEDVFSFIKWEDKEPTSIDDLLKVEGVKMEDRYLFRAKGQTDGKWYTGLLVGINDFVCYIETRLDSCIRSEGVYICEAETLGKCTGLKDRDGKLIYEGDICWHNEWDCYFKVMWNDGLRVWIADFDGDYDHLSEAIDECEIVGNIHEGPELLEDEE